MLKPLDLVGGVFMIYTITFNPAVDYVVTADTFRTGKTNRTKTENIVFGGKGRERLFAAARVEYKKHCTWVYCGLYGQSAARGR